MAAWLYQPVMFESSRMFDCMGFTEEQCEFYKQPWHNWYVADWTFALPTVALFMSTIGVFVIGYAITQILSSRRRPVRPIWRRCLAATRYMSYRGFRIEAFEWNSAPIGLLLLGLVGIIYFFCMDLIPSPYYWPGSDMVWGNSPPLGTRSGWLALACMPFLFATASKTNWITLVTGVPHEKLQVFHRWIAYAFMLLALMHTFPFIVWHIHNNDMVYQFTVSNIFEYWTGIVALVFQAWLTFASWGPFRNLGYEFFKSAHFFSAIIFMVVFFWHCGGALTSWDYFVATAAIYVPCWTYPWLRTLFEYGLGQKAQIFAEENGFVRIIVPANFRWQPGQHCFLRFRSFGIHALSSHPFTICSLPSMTSQKSSEMAFYIRPQGGLTSKLYDYAINQPGVQVPVLVDGPYGGIDNQKFFSSDRIVVAAGGSGAGWMLPFIEQFLRFHSLKSRQTCAAAEISEEKQGSDEPLQEQGRSGPRSLRIVLATREIATRTWLHTTLQTMLSEHQSIDRSLDLNIEVHLTGQAERLIPVRTKSTGVESTTSSSSEEITKENVWPDKELDNTYVPQEEIRGRPDLPLVIREEASAASHTGQTVGVFVCGPLAMQHDIRNAVAKENLSIIKNPRSGGMYLHLEHFSWA